MEEELLINFNNLIDNKNKEVETILNSKNKKMINNNSLELHYDAKKTIAKINAEQERKLKSSKSYKKEICKIIQLQHD